MNAIVQRDAKPGTMIFVLATVSSLVMLDSNVVAVALPTIARSLKADFSELQWTITAYVLPFAALLLAAGSLGDKVGRQRTALIGMAIFCSASLACGLATSPFFLNVSRAVQGVGASLVLTSSVALINHLFQGAGRARAYAVWGSCIGIAITCGPIVGGLIAGTAGWKWAFLINVPLCIALMTAVFRWIPESKDPDAEGLDYAGIVTFSSGLLLLIWGVMDGNNSGWSTPWALTRFASGFALLGAFVLVERRQAWPMLDFSIFSSRNFIGTVGAMAGYAGGAQVMIFYLPLYLQNTFSFSPIVAGVAMLPFALPMFIVPRVAMANQWGQRKLISVGLLVTSAGNIMMAATSGLDAGYSAFALAMVIAGIGAGVLNGETAKAMQGAVPSGRSGMASGVSSTTRFTALLFAVTALGALLLAATVNIFLPEGRRFGLDPDAATEVARHFSAGDARESISRLPTVGREQVTAALRHAFECGFSLAALAAAGIALASLILTRFLMASHASPNQTAKNDGTHTGE